MTQVRLYRTRGPTKANPKRYVWMLRWLGSDGKRYCERIGDAAKVTKREAKAVRQRRQGEFDCKLAPVDKPDRLTLAQFIALNRDSYVGDVTARTIQEYDLATRRLTDLIGGDRPMTSIRSADVGRLKAALRDDHKQSPATVRKTIRTLRSAFNRAVDAGVVHANPFARAAKGKTQKKPKRILEPGEIAAVMEHAPDLWWEAFICLAVTSGLRRDELLNLTWRDVRDRSVTVTRKRAGTFEVAGETFPILPFETKTHDERTVPIPDETVLLLDRMKAKSGGSEYVFLDLDRLAVIRDRMAVKPLSPSYVVVSNLIPRFKRIQMAAGIKEPLATIHDLRATYGTHTARAVPMHVLKELMGHSSISTTADYYLTVRDADADDVRSALDGLLAAGTDAQQTRRASAG